MNSVSMHAMPCHAPGRHACYEPRQGPGGAGGLAGLIHTASVAMMHRVSTTKRVTECMMVQAPSKADLPAQLPEQSYRQAMSTSQVGGGDSSIKPTLQGPNRRSWLRAHNVWLHHLAIEHDFCDALGKTATTTAACYPDRHKVYLHSRGQLVNMIIVAAEPPHKPICMHMGLYILFIIIIIIK